VSLQCSQVQTYPAPPAASSAPSSSRWKVLLQWQQQWFPCQRLEQQWFPYAQQLLWLPLCSFLHQSPLLVTCGSKTSPQGSSAAGILVYNYPISEGTLYFDGFKACKNPVCLPILGCLFLS
ncbi:hypothetical protein GOODEAATRI_023271, partial [Goodea atripinnis]